MIDVSALNNEMHRLHDSSRMEDLLVDPVVSPALTLAHVFLSEECRSAYHAAHTEKCLYCSEPVAPKKGKFSGEFFELEGKGRVHTECFESYSDATSDPCIVCKEGVRKKGRFSGDFCLFEGKKCHKVHERPEMDFDAHHRQTNHPLIGPWEFR